MPEPAESATQPTPLRPRRTRKFVLPEHHHDEQVDERTAEHIEAFLDGPDAPPRRRTPTIERPRHPLELDTRPDWMAALRQEGARHVRYGRPASVLLIELRGRPFSAAIDGVARRVSDIIRAEARETDRATRIGGLSFRILLPETGGRAARNVAERLDRAFRGQAPESVDLRIEVATAPRNGSLEDAVGEAEGRLAARA